MIGQAMAGAAMASVARTVTTAAAICHARARRTNLRVRVDEDCGCIVAPLSSGPDPARGTNGEGGGR
jgi:hypothetical protein